MDQTVTFFQLFFLTTRKITKYFFILKARLYSLDLITVENLISTSAAYKLRVGVSHSRVFAFGKSARKYEFRERGGKLCRTTPSQSLCVGKLRINHMSSALYIERQK